MARGRRFAVAIFWPNATCDPWGGSSIYYSFKEAWAEVVRCLDWGYGISDSDNETHNTEVVLKRLPPTEAEIETRALIH